MSVFILMFSVAQSEYLNSSIWCNIWAVTWFSKPVGCTCTELCASESCLYNPWCSVRKQDRPSRPESCKSQEGSCHGRETWPRVFWRICCKCSFIFHKCADIKQQISRSIRKPSSLYMVKESVELRRRNYSLKFQKC